MYKKMILTATLVDCLVDTFNQEEIIYCHWKSNIDLAQATAGEIDLDLLVDRKSLSPALAILARLGFKPAAARWGANPPSIRHFYGFDPATGQLIHVHLFSRVLTGESFVKSHLLPFEAMLLENVTCVDRIRVAAKPAELVLFTLRTYLKYSSLPDLLRLWRKRESLKIEARWLQDGGDLSASLALLREYCPVIEETLFIKCVESLTGNAPLLERLTLARQVRRRLKVYAKQSTWQRLLAYAQLFGAELQRRLGPKRKNKVLQAGGAVIAFVGADATGKSTLVTETGRWLGGTFAVTVIHTGKPPSSWLTLPVNLALALVRRLPQLRGSDRSPLRLRSGQATAPGVARWGHRPQPQRDWPQPQSASNGSSPTQAPFKGLSSLPSALRAVVLAWDRQRLILKTRRRAAAGEIIVCDRYPSQLIGAMDSPRLEEAPGKTGPVAAVYNYLARLEKQLYRQIPPPDIVLKLRVSLDTAKKRNRSRNGQDGEAYLESRHRQSQAWHLPGTRYVYDIDTEQALPETILGVKQAIWESL